MVQIHPSLPITSTDNSRVLVVKNPLRSVSADLRLVPRLRSHRIPCGFGLLALGKTDVDVDRFQERPKPDRFDFQVHVADEYSKLRSPE